MKTGVARRPIADMSAYEQSLKSRMDPTESILRGIHARARARQATMIFAEGDDNRVLRAALTYQRSGLGQALVVGRESDVAERLTAEGMSDAIGELTIVNAANTPTSRPTSPSSTRACKDKASTARTSTASPRVTATSSPPSCSPTAMATAW